MNPFKDKSFLAFAAVSAVLVGLCLAKGQDTLTAGLEAWWDMLVTVVPRMIVAIIMAGLVQVLAPREMIVKWIGHGSGLRGILVASLAGVATPGGPMVSFPLVVSLQALGADLAPLVAYLTSWALLGFQRIIMWEIPILGGRFATIRFAASLALPIIAGMTVKHITGRLAHDPDETPPA